MTKEEFLNLVYVAYNSAIKTKKESKQKIDYFSKLGIDNEESKKSQRLYDVANINIKRLKKIILLPLYEKIKQLTYQELEGYRQQLIKSESIALKEQRELIDKNMIELDKLTVLQNENYLAYTNEENEEEKLILLDEGKDIQRKINALEQEIKNQKNNMEIIQTQIYELQTKNLADIKEELIVNLNLTKLEKNEEIKYVSNDVVIEAAKNNCDVETLLQLLQEYKKNNNENYSYEIILPSENVSKQLEYLNKDKKIIENGVLNISSFGDMYSIDGVLKSKSENVNWRIKKITRECKPFFIDVQFILETLHEVKDVEIDIFKTKISLITEKNPNLLNRISYLLNTLDELNTFIGRSFKGKKINETKNLIVNSIYDFIINQLKEKLRILINCVKDINFEQNINNEVFNSEYLLTLLKKLEKENSLEVVILVNNNIDFITEAYGQLALDLNYIREESEKKNADLKVRLNKKSNKLDNLNYEINKIVGTKLQSSDLEKLIQIYSAENIADNLAKAEFLNLLNQIRNQAYLQKIEIDDLYDFKDNMILNEFEEESEAVKKV